MILKLLTGTFGNVILIAVAAVFASLLAVAGVQTWRVHSLTADLATVKLDAHTHEQNASRCLASLDAQNAKVRELEGRCTAESVAANAAAAAELKRLRALHRKALADQEHGPTGMTKFFEELDL